MKKSNLQSYLELSFAQFCIGANIILGKFLMDYFPLFSLLVIRFTLAFAIALGLLFLKEKHEKVLAEYQSLSRTDWGILFVQALCGGFLFNIFVLYGLQYTTATVAGIINSAVPALVGLFSFLILRERLTREKSFAILLCVIGIIILGCDKINETSESNRNLFGMFLIIMAVIPEALYTIFAKLLKTRISPMANTVLMNLFNAILFLPFAIGDKLSALSDLSSFLWILVFLYGLSTIFFFWFWQRGVTYVTANTAALFMGVMPISTTLLAYIFLGEALSIFDAIGLICVMIAIYIGTRGSSKISSVPIETEA